MRSTFLRCTLLLSLVLSAAAFAAPALAPGEVRYLVTLRAGATPAAVSAAGARVEAQNGSSLTVVIPAVTAGRLADLPEVVSVVEIGSDATGGTPPADGAPAHSTSEVHKLAPLDTQTLWGSGQYVYDGAGNILAMGVTGALNSDGKTSTFTYDAASRLTEAVIGRTGEDIHEQYDYDGFGNLTRHQRYSPSAQAITYPPPGPPSPVSPVTNQLTDPGSQYDVAGNATSVSGSMTMAYDAFNQAVSKTQGGHTTTYLYDVNEERIAIQTDTNVTHWTIRDFENQPLIQFDSSTALSNAGWATSQWSWVESYVHGGPGLLAAERPAGPLHYHLDHLGSPRVITDGSGQKQGSVIEYAPYGEEISTPGGELLKFTGHERDYDPGNPANDNYLDYMHARYYDARMARFLAVDPGSYSIGEPQSWNRYTYVLNNPVNASDPTGRERGRYGPAPKFSHADAKAFSKFVSGKLDQAANVAADVFIVLDIAASFEVTGGEGEQPALEKLEADSEELVDTGVETTSANAAPSKPNEEAGELRATGTDQSQPQGTSGGDRAGKDFTRAGKKEVWNRNAQNNDSKTVCEECGTEVVPPKQSQKGVTPPKNEGAVDHIHPKSQGGDGSLSNGRILCWPCNNRKGPKLLPPK